jgi:hypothetical protein
MATQKLRSLHPFLIHMCTNRRLRLSHTSLNTRSKQRQPGDNPVHGASRSLNAGVATGTVAAWLLACFPAQGEEMRHALMVLDDL